MTTKEFQCYHGTLSKYATSILNNGFKLPKVSYTHDHWLGHGVYFFDNYFLADYWASTKLNSYKGSETDKAVIEANLIAEENHICDLDNPKEALEYNKTLVSYYEQVRNNKIKIDFSDGLDKGDKSFDKTVNQRLSCFCHDLYAKDKNIHVMIYTFKKANPKYSGSLNIKNNKGNNIYIEYNERQYCVFNKDIIKNIHLCKEDYNIC